MGAHMGLDNDEQRLLPQMTDVCFSHSLLGRWGIRCWRALEEAAWYFVS